MTSGPDLAIPRKRIGVVGIIVVAFLCLSLIGLVAYIVAALTIGAVLGDAGCDRGPSACNEFNWGLSLALYGPVLVGIVAIVFAALAVTIKRSRLAWIVPVAGMLVVTGILLLGSALESAATHTAFWAISP